MADIGTWQAFRGPNGWYVAWVDQNDWHWQREGHMSRAQAERLAEERNEETLRALYQRLGLVRDDAGEQ